ncbi:lysophospholipid acyltransferase family protein [Parvibaculum sp.]|uniref:lysophospholipid acyltransferase family protein n=1 Tax=Parvibaculum sp. TaxID=2024848 RepID=UPI003BA99CFA
MAKSGSESKKSQRSGNGDGAPAARRRRSKAATTREPRSTRAAAAERTPREGSIGELHEPEVPNLVNSTLDAIAGLASGTFDGVAPQMLRELEEEVRHKIAQAPMELNSYGYDPWGFNTAVATRTLVVMALMYRYYFRATAYGIENLPAGRVLLISNHAGQIAIDAAMIGTATVLEANPPRIVRGMGEYWLPTLPLFNVLMVRVGSVVGTQKNAADLLHHGEAVIAFPEGVRGMNKSFSERYKLKEFGLGFMRLALQTNTPIVPVAVVGSEEQAPSFGNFKPLARLLGMPAFPLVVTPVPFPVRYHIYFGEPMEFRGNPNDEDQVIEAKVEQVKARIRSMLETGLRRRRSIFF